MSSSKAYWNPEQPPPETLILSAVPLGSALRILAIFFAARSEMHTSGAIVSILFCSNPGKVTGKHDEEAYPIIMNYFNKVNAL